jgi:hypothetical protein
MQTPLGTSDIKGRKRQAGPGDGDRHGHAPTFAPSCASYTAPHCCPSYDNLRRLADWHCKLCLLTACSRCTGHQGPSGSGAAAGAPQLPLVMSLSMSLHLRANRCTVLAVVTLLLSAALDGGCAAPEPRPITYADLGGIDHVLADIRELIEHPLQVRHVTVHIRNTTLVSAPCFAACSSALKHTRVKAPSKRGHEVSAVACSEVVLCDACSIQRCMLGLAWSRRGGCCCTARLAVARLHLRTRSPTSATCPS